MVDATNIVNEEKCGNEKETEKENINVGGDECKNQNIKDLWDAYRGYNNAPIQEICGEGGENFNLPTRQGVMIFLSLLSMMAFKVIKPEWGIFRRGCILLGCFYGFFIFNRLWW